MTQTTLGGTRVDTPAPGAVATCGRMLCLPGARSDVCDRPAGHARAPEPGSLAHHGAHTGAWWIDADGAQLCAASVPTPPGVCHALVPCPAHRADLASAMCEHTWRVVGSTHDDGELVTYRRHRCGVRGEHSGDAAPLPVLRGAVVGVSYWRPWGPGMWRRELGDGSWLTIAERGDGWRWWWRGPEYDRRALGGRIRAEGSAAAPEQAKESADRAVYEHGVATGTSEQLELPT